MGEGKSDRSGKRQRSSSHRGVGKSSPDLEIAHGKGKEKKGRKSKTKERWPFLEGLTVDELARYRRRRVQDRPKDNLQSHPESAQVQQDPASEYRRAFGTNIEELSKENVWPIEGEKPEDYSEEVLEDAQSSHRMDFREHEAIEDPSEKEKNAFAQLVHGNGTMETRVEVPQFEISFRRPSLIRRGTSLKCGGDFYTDTETYSAYVPYEGQHRAELARRPTSLKMEGDLDTTTEKCEKFIEWLNVSRPELMRIPTNLKMEGELETSTENQDKYVPFVGVRRPELLRRSTNLRLEGDTYFVPEYTDVFRNYNVKDRLQPKKPQTHLKADGDFFQNTESTENFVYPRIKQTQEIDAKQMKDDDEEDKWIDQEGIQKKDEEMKMLVSKLEDLNGRSLEIPEYRDAYKDFPRERPRLAKPDDEIGRADGSKVSSPSRSKFSTKIDQDPEYQSKYLDYSRDRPIYRKPPPMLRPTNVSSSGRSSACFGRPVHRQECRTFEYEPTSEVKSQYVPYGYIPRIETLKMPANLRLEGTFDLQPEYRKAYCAKYDRQSCVEPKTIYGRDDHSLSATKRREHYWLRDESSGQCDKTITAKEQNAFCILDTRMHEENVTGKPPPASRRSSRLSQTTMAPRPTQLELTDRAIATRISRSPSPSYRLHVYDVDNEPRGFGQRRQSSGRVRSPSLDRAIQDNITRPYSPSFGRGRQDRRVNDQPFVVIDNASKNVSGRSSTRRKTRTDRNVGADVTIPISRGRPRTPTRWMPPWYDNTNTI